MTNGVPLVALRAQGPRAGTATLAGIQGARSLAELREFNRQRDVRNQIGDIFRQGDVTTPAGRADIQRQAFSVDPKQGFAIAEGLQGVTDRERANALFQSQRAARLAASALSLPEGQRNRVVELAKNEMPDVFDADTIDEGFLTTVVNEARAVEDIMADIQEGKDPRRRFVPITPGGALLDVSEGAPSVAAALPPTPTGTERLLGAAGIEPGTPEFREAVVGSLRPSQTVMAPGETEFQKARGKARAESLTKIENEASQARAQIATVNGIQDILQGVNTGAFTATGAEISRIGQLFGIPLDPDVPRIEAAQALGNQLALKFRNPESGFGLTGNTSDRDVRFLQSLVPNVGQTPQGRSIVALTLRRTAERKIRAAEIAGEMEQAGNFNTTAFNRRMQEFADATPLFTEADLTFIDQQIAEQRGLPSPPPGEEGATFDRFAPDGTEVFKRPDGTFFGIKP